MTKLTLSNIKYFVSQRLINKKWVTSRNKQIKEI